MAPTSPLDSIKSEKSQPDTGQGCDLKSQCLDHPSYLPVATLGNYHGQNSPAFINVFNLRPERPGETIF